MSRFVEVERYPELSLAEIAKCKLVAEGIYTYLHSKHHIGMKWQLSTALGGVRLLVPNEHAEAAHKILGRDESHLLKAMFPDNDAEADEICQQCGSLELEYVNLRRYSGALMLLGLPLLFWGVYTKCRNCGYKHK